MSEDIRKDFPKIPRGRPKLMSGARETWVRSISGGIDYQGVTYRTVQNHHFYWDALRRFCDEDRRALSENTKHDFNWLLRPGLGDNCYPRKSMMCELGRIRDTRTMKIFAKRLCELKPPAQEAIRLIRHWRGALRTQLAFRITLQEPLTDEVVAEEARLAVNSQRASRTNLWAQSQQSQNRRRTT